MQVVNVAQASREKGCRAICRQIAGTAQEAQ
jgi:hypothetical protein